MRPEFGNDLTNTIRMQNQLVQTRLAGNAVTKVVNRCNTAKENNNLILRGKSPVLGRTGYKYIDLSECQLCILPDAVYHLMKDTPLRTCNLSGNVISKLPPKFTKKFPLIRELNLSHNRVSKLPEELADCVELRTLDISHNSFVTIPEVVFKLPKLQRLNVKGNYIMDADSKMLPTKETAIEEIDLRENPLSESTLKMINNLNLDKITVHISPKEPNEWDDL